MLAIPEQGREVVIHSFTSSPSISTPNLSGVRHGFSTRPGGVSPAPWDSLNLRPGMGDGREAMLENYRRFSAFKGFIIHIA